MPVSRPRQLSRGDLGAVTRVHVAAFPEAILTRIGPDVVERYYDWQLSEANDARAIGVYEHDDLVGFAVGGFFRDSLTGFVRANRGLILRSVLKKPWLALDKTFWSRLAMTTDALKRARAKPHVTPGASGRQPEKRKRRRYSVLSIAVDPAHRRKGIGAVLLRAQEERARGLGLPEIGLSVQLDNEAAVRFYLNQGWSKFHPRGAWTGKMTKTLVASAPDAPLR